jgi:predicted CoA-substrate-specific enzyme activase
MINETERRQEKSFFAGIDVGSRTTKAVMLKGDQVVSSAVLDTGANGKRSAEHSLALVSQQAGIAEDRIQAMVGTGYGRVSLAFVDQTVTELTCHAMGCHFIDPMIRTVIDIGGQDSKVIRLDGRGAMVDFAMNDKCAAGTGKFLEMVARTLEIDITTLAKMDAPGANGCAINSMCVVFAETEIISLLAKGEKIESIVFGINRAFASRIGNMVKRLGLHGQIGFVGGVAKNSGLARALSDYLERPFTPMDIDPQLTGALGAAVLAQQANL